MRSECTLRQGGAVLAAGIFALALAALAPASAQVAASEPAATSQGEAVAARAVGVKGAMRRVSWSDATLQDLQRLRLEKTATTLSRTPGALRHTKIWIARADVCSDAGDEVLVQIRSPLTCGTIGCEMVVLNAAGVAPRVILQTVGDTIDSPAPDALIINDGTKYQRSWRYEGVRFQQTR